MPPSPGSRTDPPPRWRVLSRGAFVFGQCEVCGYRGPGRRAPYSAESDMRAHTVLCHAAQMVALEDEVLEHLTAETALET